MKRAKLELLSIGFQGLGTARRLVAAATSFADGFALGVLSEDDRVSITSSLYARKGTSASAELFDWETDWFKQALPAAPGRILVGGAGAGREMRWLQENGYSAVGFDPVAGRVHDLALSCASYEDLVAHNSEQFQRLLQQGPYDAVLLGWGSYTHISSPEVRAELLVKLRGLCNGPVLLSFWSVLGIGKPTRAKKLGFGLGRSLGNSSTADLSADGVYSHCGYVHRFTAEEITQLAHNANYNIELDIDGPFVSRATLVQMIE